MTKSPKQLTDDDRKEIEELLSIIEWLTNEEIDGCISSAWIQVIYGYKFWIITTKQKQVLSECKKWKADKKNKILDMEIKNKLKIMEYEYEEPPLLYQIWAVQDRIVVASTKTVIIWKEEKEVANWWWEMIIEIFKDRTPEAYEYAKANYQIKQS